MLQVRKKILLIDPISDISLFTSLQKQGYEVITCESMQLAWGLVFPFRPHCIIVHLHHPTSRAMAVVQECRALAPGVPIIVAMSETRNEAVMKALEEGITSFLPLPVRPKTIKKLLEGIEPQDLDGGNEREAKGIKKWKIPKREL